MAFMFEKLQVDLKAVSFADAVCSLTKGLPRRYFRRLSMLVKTIHRQSNQAFRCLLEGLKHAPEAELQLPSDDQHASVGGMAMHIGGSIEHSLCTAAFSAKWSKPVSNKSQCIAYIESCKEDLFRRFIDEKDLLSADDQSEFFISKLDRVLKLLRHVAHHTGEINTRLRTLDVPRGPFV